MYDKFLELIFMAMLATGHAQAQTPGNELVYKNSKRPVKVAQEQPANSGETERVARLKKVEYSLGSGGIHTILRFEHGIEVTRTGAASPMIYEKGSCYVINYNRHTSGVSSVKPTECPQVPKK